MKVAKRIVDCSKADGFYVERTQAVELFFEDARKFPPLTREEERELLIAAKTGKGEVAENARRRLVESNQLFVASVAKKLNTNDNFLDIVNEGNIGLLIAIDTFDLSTDNRFRSYAVHWIRKKINDYNVKYSMLVRPRNANLIYTYARKARNSFFLKNERYPTLDELKDEIKEQFNANVPDKHDLEQFVIGRIAGEGEIDETNHRCDFNSSILFSLSEISTENNVDANNSNNDNQNVVREMLSSLSDKKREIIQRMYGIGTDVEETPSSIAMCMGLSVSTVKKMANEAIAEMKARSLKMAI